MKLQTSITLTVLSAALLAVAGCSTKPKTQESTMGAAAQTDEGQLQAQSQGQSAQAVAVRPGEPGGVVVQTYEQTATVKTIDKQTRKITLTDADGAEIVVKAGPEVANFDQIEVGDKVKATITEQLVIFVRKSGEAPGLPQATTVALAPIGAKPGLTIADTTELTGKVTAIDPENHKATLQFPDGTTKTFKVRNDVDLTKRSVGEEVVIRSTEAMALRVEKP